MKKILVALLALSTAVCTACGGSKKGSGDSDVKADKVDVNTVFQASDVDLGDLLGDNSSINSLTAAKDGYNAVVTDWSKEKDGGTLVTFKQDGSDVATKALPDLEENVTLSAAGADSDGNVYRILDLSTYDEDGNYQSGKIYLQKTGSDGKQAWSIDLYAPDENSDDTFQMSGFLTNSPDGNLYICEADTIEGFGMADGSKQGSCKVPENGDYGNLAADGNGDVVYCCSTDTGTGLYKVNLKKGTCDEIKIDDENALNYSTVYSGTDSTVYTGSDKGIYSVDVTSGKASLCINYIASDLDVDDMQNLAGLDSDHFCCSYSDSSGTDKILILKKANPDVYNNKTVLTLGYTDVDQAMRERVIAFNRSSEKYRINLTQYSSDSDDDYGSAINKVLLTGDMPDMVILNYGQDYTSYEKKGVFEPLDSYFGKNGPSSDEYLTNIFDAFRVGGEMYILPTSFTVRCLVGKQSDFGDVSTLTVDQLRQAAKKKGIKTQDCMGPYMTKDDFLTTAVSMTVKDYVDFESGTCSFDSDTFKNLLQFANEFQSEIKDDTVNDNDGEAGIRNNTQAVMDQAISSFSDYNQIITGYVGEATAFMGYPGSGKSGPAISVETQVAMSASSKNKDACWQFMKSLIGEDDSSSTYEYSFPVNIKRLEKQGQDATQPEYYLDENGQRQVVDQRMSVGDTEIKINPLTQDQVDTWENLLKSLDTTIYYDASDSSIYSIVSEEAGAYFAGQKSVDDVADTIQRRVRIYINENK